MMPREPRPQRREAAGLSRRAPPTPHPRGTAPAMRILGARTAGPPAPRPPLVALPSGAWAACASAPEPGPGRVAALACPFPCRSASALCPAVIHWPAPGPCSHEHERRREGLLGRGKAVPSP